MGLSKHRVALLSALLPAAVAFSGCAQQTTTTKDAAPPAAAAPSQSPAERGKVLVQVGGCHDCHTTKKNGAPDMSVMLSGHPASIKVPPAPKSTPPWIIHTTDTLTVWNGPWGTSYAANLTPDPDTGLKSSAWSEDAFLKAMKTGKHIGTGRDILPPMPWQMYSQLSDDDLKAIWAYLQTIPPVKNEVPDPVPPGK